MSRPGVVCQSPAPQSGITRSAGLIPGTSDYLKLSLSCIDEPLHRQAAEFTLMAIVRYFLKA